MNYYRNGKSFIIAKSPLIAIPEGCVEITKEEYEELRAHEKKPALDNNLREITKLKKRLESTDYKAIKYFEGWLSEEEYAPIKAEREEIREQIRRLEKGE